MGEIDRKIGGITLGVINFKPNRRKAELYWIGFLSGLLASGRLENTERFPLIAEAEHFFRCLGDPDAYDLVQDLAGSDQYPNDEIYEMIETIVEIRGQQLGELKIRDQTNYFLGQCAGVVCDQTVLSSGARKILETASVLSIESKDARVSEFACVLKRALKDSIIDHSEELEIIRWIQRFVGDAANDTGLPTAESSPDLPFADLSANTIDLAGSEIVLTGAFRRGPRCQIEEELVARGARISKNVTMNIRYLIVASKNSRDWKYHQFGQKIELALNYKMAGATIDLLTETLLDELLLS
jgi:hypothetical protein